MKKRMVSLALVTVLVSVMLLGCASNQETAVTTPDTNTADDTADSEAPSVT